jgi:glucan 1,3-beta-glucosidase
MTTAPGSQNGFDNSGKRGDINWISGGGAPGTLDAVQALADRYAQETDVVTAIELLNEPANWGNDMDAVKKFYYDGWGNVRNANGDTAVVFSDAFLDTKDYWNGFMGPGSGVNNVMIDTHIYSIFSDGEVGRSPCEHVSVACSKGPKLAAVDKWVIVGEWTAAQTDCARWLNGLGRGARYDQTFGNENYHGSCDGKYEGTVAGLSQADKTNIEYFVEAQLDAWEQGDGWVFWTWKTESAPEWNLRDLIREGLFPQPLTSRKHPGQCQTGCQIPSK